MTIALSTQPCSAGPNTANPLIVMRFTEEASPRAVHDGKRPQLIGR
ncbi:hypothetical protein [Hydrogenophaga sp.]|nr:hypothetical protein [Hydrogenophaga sp.]